MQTPAGDSIFQVYKTYCQEQLCCTVAAKTWIACYCNTSDWGSKSTKKVVELLKQNLQITMQNSNLWRHLCVTKVKKSNFSLLIINPSLLSFCIVKFTIDVNVYNLLGHSIHDFRVISVVAIMLMYLWGVLIYGMRLIQNYGPRRKRAQKNAKMTGMNFWHYRGIPTTTIMHS